MDNENTTYYIFKNHTLDLIEAYLEELLLTRKILDEKIAGLRRAQGEAIDKLAEENQK